MKFRFAAGLARFAVLLPAFAALALSPKPPGHVALTGNANLRAKPSLNAEILVSLKKGQVFLELGRTNLAKAPADEPREWVELAAPAGTKVWVFAALIDPASKTARADRVHLRAGPGRNFEEVGHLKKGDVVQELRASDGWIQIAAPEGAVVGFVAANLVRPADADLAPKPQPPTPVAAAPTATNAPRAVMLPPTGGVTKAPGRTAPVPLPPNLSTPRPAPGRSVPIAANVTGQPLTPPVPVPAPAPVSTPVDTTATPVPANPAPTPAPAPPVPLPSIPSPNLAGQQAEIVHSADKPRQVLRQGVIALAVSPQAPGRYQLDSFRRSEGMLGFLITDDAKIKLNDWHGKQVVIFGEEYLDPRWSKYSVIKVLSIEAAN